MGRVGAAYEFREADAVALKRADCDSWRVGESRVFERVKIRNEAGVHVADAYLEVPDADD